MVAHETSDLLIFVGLCKSANELSIDVVKSLVGCSKAMDSKKLLNNSEESREGGTAEKIKKIEIGVEWAIRDQYDGSDTYKIL
jgi:hypothetical protein